MNEEIKNNPVIDWRTQPKEFWRTKTYYICAIRNHHNDIGLVCIRRRDWKPCSDWRDKQAIKNHLLGPEWEAAELYPAESRVQDQGNWYHLWVMPKGGRYSFGFRNGERSDKPAKSDEVQRPLAQRGDVGSLERVLVQAKPFIAMPCYGGIPVEVALSIMKVDRELPFPHAIRLTRGDSLVSRARNRLATDFMEACDCTHLLFIDSDVVFEPEHIVRLLSHNEAIVGGLYALKADAFHWCVDGILKPRPDGLVEVRHTGAGFMAVKREVFERMIEAFGPEIGYTAYDCDGGRTEHDFVRVGVFDEQENKVTRLYSEDWGFCERARELGYKIYVDPKIALKHIGQASYPLNPLPALCRECLSLATPTKEAVLAGGDTR